MNEWIFVIYIFCISSSQIYGRSVDVTDTISQNSNEKSMDADENRFVNSLSETPEGSIKIQPICKYINS